MSLHSLAKNTVRMSVSLKQGTTPKNSVGALMSALRENWLFQITQESAIASGTRRIEAVVGTEAIAANQTNSSRIAEITAPSSVP